MRALLLACALAVAAARDDAATVRTLEDRLKKLDGHESQMSSAEKSKLTAMRQRLSALKRSMGDEDAPQSLERTPSRHQIEAAEEEPAHELERDAASPAALESRYRKLKAKVDSTPELKDDAEVMSTLRSVEKKLKAASGGASSHAAKAAPASLERTASDGRTVREIIRHAEEHLGAMEASGSSAERARARREEAVRRPLGDPREVERRLRRLARPRARARRGVGDERPLGRRDRRGAAREVCGVARAQGGGGGGGGRPRARRRRARRRGGEEARGGGEHAQGEARRPRQVARAAAAPQAHARPRRRPRGQPRRRRRRAAAGRRRHGVGDGGALPPADRPPSPHPDSRAHPPLTPPLQARLAPIAERVHALRAKVAANPELADDPKLAAVVASAKRHLSDLHGELERGSKASPKASSKSKAPSSAAAHALLPTSPLSALSARRSKAKSTLKAKSARKSLADLEAMEEI